MKTVKYSNSHDYYQADICKDCMLKKHSSLGCRAGVTRVLRSDVDGKQNTVVGGVVECDFRMIQGCLF